MIKHTVIKVEDYNRPPAFKWAVDEDGEPYVLTENSMEAIDYISLIDDEDDEDYYEDDYYTEDTEPNSHYTEIHVEEPLTWKGLFNG